MSYVELQATSHFSFLRGASSCELLFEQARLCGFEALAIVDRNSLAGIVRAHEAAKASDVRLIVGSRLDLIDGTGVLVYPTDRPAYSRLTRLLSLGKRRAGKAKCHLDWSDLKDWSEGLIAILVPEEADEACAVNLRRLKATFPAGAYLALTLRRRPGDALRLHDLSNLAVQAGVPTVVTNDVLFHHRDQRLLQDVVTCVNRSRQFADIAQGFGGFSEMAVGRGGQAARLVGQGSRLIGETFGLTGGRKDGPDIGPGVVDRPLGADRNGRRRHDRERDADQAAESATPNGTIAGRGRREARSCRSRSAPRPWHGRRRPHEGRA